MKIRYVLIVIAGVIATYLLTYLFTYLEVRYGSGAIARHCFATRACSEEEFYGAVMKGIFRSGYIYNPATAFLVAIGVSLFSKGRATYILILLAILPFSILHIVISSFRMESVFQVAIYGLLAFTTGFVVQRIKGATSI